MTENIQLKKLKILIINSDLTSKGGIASVIQTLYLKNKERGCPANLALLKTSHYKEKNRLHNILIFIKSLFFYIYMLIFDKLDIIHIHSGADISFYRKSIMVFISKCFRKKVLFHIHASKFYDFFLTDNPIKLRLIKTVFKYSDIVVVLCKDWETKLKEKYNNINIVTLHNPINIKDCSENEVKSDSETVLRVLFLAFLIKSKGVYDLIELAKLLKKNDIKNICFVIGGKGELENKFIEAIDRYGLSDIIVFHGWVNGSKKKELLMNSDVFFLPSYNEGMPIAILEAMCSGLPILSTNISGIPDLVQNKVNGYLVDPGDINRCYEILLKWAGNKEIAKTMGKESYRLVQGFDAEIIFDRMLRLYNNVV